MVTSIYLSLLFRLSNEDVDKLSNDNDINRGDTILHHGGLHTDLNQCNQGSLASVTSLADNDSNDHFVRRSIRNPDQNQIGDIIKTTNPDDTRLPLEIIKDIPGKGRGIVATKKLSK